MGFVKGKQRERMDPLYRDTSRSRTGSSSRSSLHVVNNSSFNRSLFFCLKLSPPLIYSPFPLHC